MDLTTRWSHLADFCTEAATHAELEVWLFGSALHVEWPADLDTLVIYRTRSDVVQLRSERPWHLLEPPLHIIAMTRGEESFYEFIRVTEAARLV